MDEKKIIKRLLGKKSQKFLSKSLEPINTGYITRKLVPKLMCGEQSFAILLSMIPY